jgi:drug/metabolite transporter (DMT)-like permease
MVDFRGSIEKNFNAIILILISAILLSIGQLIWKFSAGHDILLLLTGFVIYGIGAVFMIAAYRHGTFSTIHPMMSTSYILAFLFGWLFLDEKISLIMVAGLILILVGNIFIGVGDA